MKIHQIQQISEMHCGPAVLQMLLDVVGIQVSQQQITDVLNVREQIIEHGVRPDQLGRACSILAPTAQFWYKYHANIDDIAYILKEGYAVGVEWQGLFYESEEEEARDMGDESDFGHYSIISYYDETEQLLVIVDPYKDFVNQDRIFDVPVFLKRWWDTNELIDPNTGHKQIVEDKQLLFFVAPQGKVFKPEFNFKAFHQS